MQREFKNFRFKGIGWYREEGDDTLLVLEGPDKKYWIYCWNGSDPRVRMRELLEQPEYT